METFYSGKVSELHWKSGRYHCGPNTYRPNTDCEKYHRPNTDHIPTKHRSHTEHFSPVASLLSTSRCKSTVPQIIPSYASDTKCCMGHYKASSSHGFQWSVNFKCLNTNQAVFCSPEMLVRYCTTWTNIQREVISNSCLGLSAKHKLIEGFTLPGPNLGQSVAKGVSLMKKTPSFLRSWLSARTQTTRRIK